MIHRSSSLFPIRHDLFLKCLDVFGHSLSHRIIFRSFKVNIGWPLRVLSGALHLRGCAPAAMLTSQPCGAPPIVCFEPDWDYPT